MKVEIQDKKVNQIQADYEVIFVIGKKLKHKWIHDEKFFKEIKFQGAVDQVACLVHKRRVYIGIESLQHDNLRNGIALAMNTLKETTCKSFKIGSYVDDTAEESIQAITEGSMLGAYNFDLYKSKKQKIDLKKIIISTEEYSNKSVKLFDAKKAIKQGTIISEATNFTRDIVNQIPAEITPVRLAEIAKELAKDNDLEVKVHGEKYIEKSGMGAFLAVSKASPYPPQLIHLIHKIDKPKAKICLVGKGLTYDSGGLSLKPSEFMVTMKSDKSGASAVIGIMKAISKLNLPIEVHGIIGAVENVVGKHAFKPDDVLTAKNGKTIEVKNTDAEGRLVLADCLCYAQDLKPDYLIDIATLTGACMVALGEYTTGVIGHNHELKQEILEAGGKSGELLADLPFNKYLSKLMKSEVADMSNLSASKYGGAITAGVFLSEFIAKEYKDKWVHLDIAGPSYVEKIWGCNPHGASGAGVRLVISWMKSIIR